MEDPIANAAGPVSVTFVCLAGFFFAALFYRRCPKASLWAFGAFALVVFLSVYIVVGEEAVPRWRFGLLRAATYLLLLIAIFAGRPDAPVTAETSNDSLWGTIVKTYKSHPSIKTVFLSVFLIVCLGSTVVTFMLPETFTSAARIKVERDRSDISSIGSLPGAQGALAPSYDPHFIETEFEVLGSEAILGKVVDDAGFYLPGFEDLPRQMKIEVLKRGTLDLRPVRNTSIIEIRVYSRDKNAAAKVANTIAQTYKAHRLEERKRLTQGGIDALTNRLAAVQMELDRARSKVAALQSDKQSQACLAATQDLEQLQRLRQILFEKISFERIELDLPKTSMVEMIDPATPARTPIYPKKALNVATGMLTGVLLGSLASALVPWLILSARKSPILSA